MPQRRVKIVITGDDFGYCPRRNQGIVECFLAGAISNVSLLVNASAAKDAAELAKRHNIPIGLHANLSEGLPICEQLRKESSLLNEDGFFHGKMGFRKALKNGLIKMSEVAQELRAQVQHFYTLTNQLPHHMDGHQHVHVLPEIRHVFAQVLYEFGIRYTRMPIEPGLRHCSWLEQHLMDFYMNVEQDALNSIDVFKNHKIRWPDAYIGLSTMGKNASLSTIQFAIENAISAGESTSNIAHEDHLVSSASSSPEHRALTVELMVHPGYPSIPEEGGCGEGPDDFSQSLDRVQELNILKNPELLKYYKRRNIQLCAFKDL
ncbi:carbohydrate deacetylase isoform X2 [Protopterus annectens]|nr:carbohydrate deacetylase isoform X2 [Protopterus annectens]XP_043912999.1 carbohydrate deacetylase isoform X2 [Protopterus annectens]